MVLSPIPRSSTSLNMSATIRSCSTMPSEILILAGDAAVLGLDMGAEMHAGRIPPAEERRPGILLARDEVLGSSEGFLIDGFHPLLGQRSGILDGLPAFAVRFGAEHTTWAELFEECGILRVVEVFGLLGGVQMIQAPEIFVEPMDRRQMLVAIAEMVLAELAGGIADILQQRRNGWIAFLPAFLGAGEANLVIPVRTGTVPPMKAARPAVQLCWP